MDIRFLASNGYDLYSGGGTGTGSGSIELEYGWQLISIPITYGYWNASTHAHIHDDITVAKFKNYVLDQITDLYGSGIIQVANTYTGDAQEFYSYVVGSTPESSKHNFKLTNIDGTNYEISGFWIKVIGTSGPYTITWGPV